MTEPRLLSHTPAWSDTESGSEAKVQKWCPPPVVAPNRKEPGEPGKQLVFASGLQIHQGASLNFAGNSGLLSPVLGSFLTRAPGTGGLSSAFLGIPFGREAAITVGKMGREQDPLSASLLPPLAQGYFCSVPCGRGFAGQVRDVISALDLEQVRRRGLEHSSPLAQLIG